MTNTYKLYKWSSSLLIFTVVSNTIIILEHLWSINDQTSTYNVFITYLFTSNYSELRNLGFVFLSCMDFIIACISLVSTLLFICYCMWFLRWDEVKDKLLHPTTQLALPIMHLLKGMSLLDVIFLNNYIGTGKLLVWPQHSSNLTISLTHWVMNHSRFALLITSYNSFYAIFILTNICHAKPLNNA